MRRITIDVCGVKIRLIPVYDELWDSSGETNMSSWIKVNFVDGSNPLEVISHEIGHVIFSNFYADAIKNNADLSSVNEICASISEKTVMAIAKNEKKINEFITSAIPKKSDNLGIKSPKVRKKDSELQNSQDQIKNDLKKVEENK